MLEPEWQRPDPPGVRPVPSRNPWLPFILLGSAAALVVVAVYVPIPIFWRYVPGEVQDVEDLVEIDGATDYSSNGSLYLTTVSIDTSVTFVEWVGTAFDGDTAVVLKDDVTQGGTEEDLLEQARQDMRDSKISARNVAFAELGFLKPAARITRVVSGSPAESGLEVGDVILSIEGAPIYTVCESASEIRAQGVDQPVTFTVRRDGRTLTVDLSTEALDPKQPDVAMVGIVMKQLQVVKRGAPGVQIDTGQIGGPSAGLMFALGIYDRLTPDDVTHGREIAGTGVIGCDGSVQPIGGVQQKVAAAEDLGAEVFLSPAANLEAAQAAADDIEVVSVPTFDDAVEYLAGLS